MKTEKRKLFDSVYAAKQWVMNNEKSTGLKFLSAMDFIKKSKVINN